LAKRIRINDDKASGDKPLVSLFMDSGVFGAWARGMSLDLKKYISFIRRNESKLRCYATMDVIPGKFGVARTTHQVEESASQSYKNHQVLKDAGLTPIPIFHQGESFHWLEKMITEGEPYVGISTAKDLTKTDHREWLDRVFTMITDSRGVPYIKTHGFGVTAIDILLRYPWYTSDSTTWALAAGYGLIYIPVFDKGKFDYSRVPTRIIMSGREQQAWSSVQRQFDSLGPQMQAVVTDYLAHVGHLSVEQVRYDADARRRAMLCYFEDFVSHYKIKPFPHRHGFVKSLFKAAEAPKLWEHMTILYATSPQKQRKFNKLLTSVGANTRLVSYFDLVDHPEADEILDRYVTHGIDDLEYKHKVPTAVWDEYYSTFRRLALKQRLEMLNETD
jgi:hypothetical protein